MYRPCVPSLPFAVLCLVALACGGGGVDGPTVPAAPPTPAAVASVAVSNLPSALEIGGTALLSATTADAAGNALSGRTITWGSSAPTVATVSSGGLVTAVGSGAATITASSEGKTGSANTTVAASKTIPPTLQNGLTFKHLDGYLWESASVYSASDVGWYTRVTFHWESTAYVAGGNGTIYGVQYRSDETDPGNFAAKVQLISATDLDSVTRATCSGLAYGQDYSRIGDGQILCLRRTTTGELAAIQLVSHVSDPDGTYALSAVLRVKMFEGGSPPP